MSDDQPKDGEAWMPFLMRKGRFAECVLLGWQAVEDKIDQMTAQVFELDFVPVEYDPRVDLLREISFRKKVQLLKVMGKLSDHDSKIIHKFADERNKLFHGDVFALQHPVAMPQAEKIRLMELANAASQIAGNRAFGVWVSEETNDVGNKDTPKPEEHQAVKRLKEIRSMFAALQPNVDNAENQGGLPKT